MPKALIIALAILTTTATLHAATITVTTTQDALADTGFCSLREAIISANTNAPSGGTSGECPAGSSGSTDTVVLPSGTFNLTLTGAESNNAVNALLGDLDIVQSVSVQGAGAVSTMISGAALGARVFHIAGATAQVGMTSLRISGGNSSGSGGGIFLDDGVSLTLAGVSLTGNHADGSGGGIYAAADLSIASGLVTGNTSVDAGGGIFATGILTITGSNIAGNQANGVSFGRGGGVWAGGNAFVLTGSTVMDNYATGGGGGMWVESSLSGALTTVSGNESDEDGGGIQFDLGGGGVLENSTLSGNTAAGDGGAVAVNVFPAHQVSVTHCTLAGNTASQGSAFADPNGDVTVANTVIAGTCSGEFLSSLGGNIESPGDNCGLTHVTDQVAVSAGALALGPLANNGGATLSHLPSGISVAVDTARAIQCLATDQRGEARPQGSGCDVGAIEIDRVFIFSDGFEIGSVNQWSGHTP